MIRTLFTILIVLFLIASAFLAFFIVTFDADAYRPLVITKLESALGKPVELQGISLGWNDGIALKLRGLAVYPGETKAGEPVVQFDEASTLVRFFPLLQKDVEISALKLIRPSLHLLRTGAGEVILYEAKPPLKPDAGSAVPEIRPIGEVVKPAAEKPAAAPVVPPVPLLIDTVEIEDGILRFTDQTGELKQDLIINQIQITLRNVSYSRSVPFRVDLAVLSGKQNVQVEGRFRLEVKEQAFTIENFNAETDLDLLDWQQLEAIFPPVKTAGLSEKPMGRVKLEVQTLRFDPAGLADLKGNVYVHEGRVNLKDVKSPLKGIELEAAIEKEKVQVKNISFQIADGGVKGLGAIAQLTTRPQVGFEVKAEQLNLENLLPDPNPGEPSLTGQFSGSFQGTAVGMDWPQMAPTMAGKGEVSLVNGVLLNLNILQEVFRNLSVIPGLADKLKSRLPESYEAKLSARDTVLKPIQFPIMMQQGVASVRDAQIGADTFDLRGTGSFGLNGSVEMQTFLSVDADLSKAFIGSVNELQYLTNPQGQLQIPIRISGIAPDLRVLPDLQYVASKLAVSKTQEVIGKILEKKLGGNETESQPAAEAPTEQKKPDLLGQLIQSALEGSGAFGGKQESKPQRGTT